MPTLQSLLALFLVPAQGNQDEVKIQWFESVSAAQAEAGATKKGILLYVQPRGEINPPPAFDARQVVDASKEIAVFVRIRLDGDDPFQREMRIEGAPMIVAMDQYFNSMGAWAGTPSVDRIIEVVTALPDWIVLRRSQLRSHVTAARGHLERGNSNEAVRLISEVFKSGLKGHPEVVEARAMLDGLAKESFERIEKLQGVQTFKSVAAAWRAAARTFSGTPYAAAAELKLASFQLESGDAAGAVAQIARTKRTYPDQAAQADALMLRVAERGIADVRSALEEGLKGDPSKTLERLRALERAYAGTEAADHIASALADLQR